MNVAYVNWLLTYERRRVFGMTEQDPNPPTEEDVEEEAPEAEEEQAEEEPKNDEAPEE